MNKHVIGFLVIFWLYYSVSNLGHPVTPQFISDINAPIYMTGVLFGIMALAQFIFAPFWGQASDIFGRRIAIIGPFGYAIGQLGFVFFDDPVLLIIFRFISGAFAVIMLIIPFAYISDKSNLEDKAKYLAIAAILMPIGIFMGYSFGGLIGIILSPRLTFFVQAILSIALGVVLYFYMQTDVKCVNNCKIKWNIIKENIEIMKRNKDTGLKYVLIVTFLNIIAYQLTFSQAAVILQSGFDKSTSYIGLYIALFNLIAGLSSFAIQSILFKKFNNRIRLLPYLSLFSLFASLLAFSIIFTSPSVMWVGLMLNVLLNTLFIALIQDTITRIDKHDEKGALIGVNQSVQALGMFFGATLAGILISSYLFAPLLIGAAMFFLTFVVNKFIISNQLEHYIGIDENN